MSQANVHHPIFARMFSRLVRLMEPEVGPRRSELVAGLSGSVVEVGAGSGANFGHYPPTVEQVVAVEPEPYLRGLAERAAHTAPVSVTVRDGLAGSLPLASSSCDAAVASLVLCTVPDQTRALAELWRVLKPGGELRFMEHVHSDHAHKARAQRALDRSGIWPLFAGGCHCARDTVGALAAAGFEVVHVRSFDLGPGWMVTNPHVLGVARRRERAPDG
jgi:ubiquinone/menaquinone biosynthesis C-methylase UbiE